MAGTSAELQNAEYRDEFNTTNKQTLSYMTVLKQAHYLISANKSLAHFFSIIYLTISTIRG